MISKVLSVQHIPVILKSLPQVINLSSTLQVNCINRARRAVEKNQGTQNILLREFLAVFLLVI